MFLCSRGDRCGRCVRRCRSSESSRAAHSARYGSSHASSSISGSARSRYSRRWASRRTSTKPGVAQHLEVTGHARLVHPDLLDELARPSARRRGPRRGSAAVSVRRSLRGPRVRRARDRAYALAYICATVCRAGPAICPEIEGWSSLRLEQEVGPDGRKHRLTCDYGRRECPLIPLRLGGSPGSGSRSGPVWRGQGTAAHLGISSVRVVGGSKPWRACRRPPHTLIAVRWVGCVSMCGAAAGSCSARPTSSQYLRWSEVKENPRACQRIRG